MSNEGAGARPPRDVHSKAGKRDEARLKARELRTQRKKKERRNKYLLQGGIIVSALLIVGIVAFTIVSQIPTTRIGPANMLSDGIKIGEGFVAQTTPGLKPDEEPVPFAVDEESEVIDIRVYLDYQCPACKLFEETNNAQLATWVSTGAATVEFHPIAMFDRYSLGTKYSSRAAGAAACVASHSPNSFFDFNAAMFKNQPKEGTEGLDNEQLAKIAKGVDVAYPAQVERCILDQDYKTWVNAATARAIEGPIPNSSVERVAGTPTVIVNGEQYTGAINDPTEFAKFVGTASGKAFTQKMATPTPAPAEEQPAEEQPAEEQPAEG